MELKTYLLVIYDVAPCDGFWFVETPSTPPPPPLPPPPPHHHHHHHHYPTTPHPPPPPPPATPATSLPRPLSNLFFQDIMHLSICNLNIPPPPFPPNRAYHGHLTPSFPPRVGHFTFRTAAGVGNLTLSRGRWGI